MRHHAHHVTALIADACDVVQRPVGIIGIAQHHAVFRLQRGQRAVVRVVAAFAVRHWNGQGLTALGRSRKRRVGGFDANRHRPADKFQLAIAEQRAGQQPALDQHLKSVADSEHQPALGGEALDRGHHRREFRDGAAAQIVSVRETTRQYHRVY